MQPKTSILSVFVRFLLITVVVVAAKSAQAQTWSSRRGVPALWQVVAIDRTGELGFPYGQEDVAGDGLSAFADDEAGSDLRTLYAHADRKRLWLRAYVTARMQPPEPLIAFFFLNTDENDATGGPAHGADVHAALGVDPTAGGYDLVLVSSADGAPATGLRWSDRAQAWQPLTDLPQGAVEPEIGRAPDPLGVGDEKRGYLQLAVAHDLTGLTTPCTGRLFVRLLHDDPEARTFGDDPPAEVGCRIREDAYGDPEVLRAYRCTSDSACPADGRCRSGICLFAYTCDNDGDCAASDRCSDGRCVRTLDRTCADDTACDGLVCSDGRCTACAESGEPACAAGSECAPSGVCLDPARLALEDRPVRGGAFRCSTACPGADAAPLLGFWLTSGAGLWWRRRRSHAQGNTRRHTR